MFPTPSPVYALPAAVTPLHVTKRRSDAEPIIDGKRRHCQAPVVGQALTASLPPGDCIPARNRLG